MLQTLGLEMVVVTPDSMFKGMDKLCIGTDSAQTMLHIKFVHGSLNNSIGEYIRLEDNSNYSVLLD